MAVATTILGASGYSGQETLDRVLSHPELELVALGSDSLAGSPASVLDPRLNGSLPAFVTNEEALAAGAELVFCCLEHERAAALEPPADAVVVDLSGAHRLADPSLYPSWYGFEHPAAGALADWSYAIPELFPPEGPLIANPGCYATAVLLALAPLVDAIEPAGVVVDAKSGVSGAGRTLKASSHATSVLENVSPYKVGSHQHAPEIAQALGFPVCFVPHLLPVKRGLLATCYVTATADLRDALEAAYAAAPGGDRAAGGARARALARPGNRRRRDRRLHRPLDRDRRSSSARSTTSARAQRARRCRTRTSRSACPRRPGSGSPGCSYERHRREGLRRRRCPRGHPAQGARPGRRPLDRPRRRRGDVHRQPGPGRARRRLEGASRVGRAAGDRDQLGRRERGHRRARPARRARDRRRGGAAARPLRRGGARPLDRRDRRVAAAREGARRPARGGAGALAGGRPRRGGGDPDHRHEDEGGGRLARRVHRRRDGEGLRDDPPAARDDARRADDRLPARAGRGDRLPPARGRAQLQLDLGRRRVLDERRRLPARQRRQRDRADARLRHRLRARARPGLRAARGADRRRRRGRDRARRDRGQRRRRRRAGARDRGPDRHLAARQDRALRPRRQLGPRARGRRARRRGTAASRPSTRRGDALLQRHGRARPRRRRSASSRTSRTAAAGSSSTSASARARPAT